MGRIDHLVYAVPNLEESIDWFEETLGVRPVFGGYHKTQGTKNALVHLGGECYLEILAIDEENTEIQPPRWMGVDLIDQPLFTRWALKTRSVHFDCEILKQYNPEMGDIQTGQRKTADGGLLKWEMTMPMATPKIELAPFLLNWEESAEHPTKKLSEECELIGIVLCHPDPRDLQKIFNDLSTGLVIAKSDTTKLTAIIKCPKGIVEVG